MDVGVETRSQRKPSHFAVLSVPGFRKLWMAQVVSQLGDAFAEITLIYLVAARSESAAQIGLLIFAMLLPTAAIGPFAGVLVDRVPQRRIMILADIWRLFVVALMLPAVQTGNVLILLGLVVTEGIGTAFFGPARAAIIPRVVTPQRIADAVSLSQTTAAGLRIVGPGLGGLLLATIGPAWVFAVDAGTFALSALILLGLPVLKPPGSAQGRGEGYLASLRTGVVSLGASPSLRFIVFLLAGFSLIFGVVNTTMNGVLVQEFGLAAGTYGATQTAYGAGAAVGSVWAPMLIGAAGGAVLLVGATGFLGVVMASLVLVGLSVSMGLDWMVYPWAVLLGLTSALLNVTSQTLLITWAPSQLLGRVVSLMQSAVNTANMAGILAGGWIASRLTSLDVTAGAGVVTVVLALGTLFSGGYRAVRALEQGGREREQARREGRVVEGGESGGPQAAAERTRGEASAVAWSAGAYGVPMRESFLVRSVTQWVGLASRDNLRLLALLEHGACSLEEMADALGQAEGRLYEMLGGLESAGVVVSDPENGSYRLTARDVRVGPAVLGLSGLEQLIGQVVEPGLTQLRRLVAVAPRELPPEEVGPWMKAHGYQLQLTAQVLRMHPSEWTGRVGQLEQVLKELASEEPASEERIPTQAAADDADNGHATYVFTVLSFRMPTGDEAGLGQRALDRD